MDRAVNALVVLSCVALGACGGDEPDFEITHNQRPLESCELSSRSTGRAIREGTFDLAIGDRFSYLLTPVVANRTGTDIIVSAARVQALDETAGEPALLRFLCEGGEVCDLWDLSLCSAGGSRCPVVPAGGTASFEVPILSRTVTGYFQGMMDTAVAEGRNPPSFDLRAEVRLVGTSGAEEVVSETFSYAVTLCLGCLVDFPPGSDSPALSGPDCCGVVSGPPPCQPGQDEPFDCQLCTRTLPEICNFGRITCGS